LCHKIVALQTEVGTTNNDDSMQQDAEVLNNRLRVFENRVLRRIFGLKRDEIIDGWRKLHNEEFYNLYS
jgi:hypothetical protein